MRAILVYFHQGKYEEVECVHEGVYLIPDDVTPEQVEFFVRNSCGANAQFEPVSVDTLTIVAKPVLAIDTQANVRCRN